MGAAGPAQVLQPLAEPGNAVVHASVCPAVQHLGQEAG